MPFLPPTPTSLRHSQRAPHQGVRCRSATLLGLIAIACLFTKSAVAQYQPLGTINITFTSTNGGSNADVSQNWRFGNVNYTGNQVPPQQFNLQLNNVTDTAGNVIVNTPVTVIGYCGEWTKYVSSGNTYNYDWVPLKHLGYYSGLTGGTLPKFGDALGIAAAGIGVEKAKMVQALADTSWQNSGASNNQKAGYQLAHWKIVAENVPGHTNINGANWSFNIASDANAYMGVYSGWPGSVPSYLTNGGNYVNAALAEYNTPSATYHVPLMAMSGATTGSYPSVYPQDLILRLPETHDYGDLAIAGTTFNTAGGGNPANAPRHAIGGTLKLGTSVDGDLNGMPTGTALGDDATAGYADDEDGVTFPTLARGQTANITVTVTGTGGKLNGWIDWNDDGDFLDSGEHIVTNLATVAGSNTVAVTVPGSTVISSILAARFRLSSIGNDAATSGTAADGEIEDYMVQASCPTITLSPTTLPNGTVNTAYSQTITGSGGSSPYTFAVTTGTLPTGLSMTSGGVISGTPTSTVSKTFTITSTDANGCTGTRSYTVVPACPAITLSPTTLPNGTVNTAYNQTVTASGGIPPYTFAVTTGTLPTGLSMTSGGVISGTPTSTVSKTFTITSTDANGCTGTKSYTVVPACPTLSLNSTPALLPTGTIGTAYSASISTTGGVAPYTYAVTSGALPNGLSLSNGGAISGTAIGPAGSDSFTVTSTDANGCTGTVVLNITITGGSITGTVWSDTDNDNVGDAGIGGVTLTLLDSSGNIIDGDSISAGVQPITAITNGSGQYTFANLAAGTYGVSEDQPPGYLDVTDIDLGDLSEIRPITVTAGIATTGQDFVEELEARIEGCVHRDHDHDNSGDTFITGVTITLYTDPNGDGDPSDGAPVDDPLQSGYQPYVTQTDEWGIYHFQKLPAGSYVVVETQPNGYLTETDNDATVDAVGSPADAPNSSGTDNRIPVTLAAGELDDGNDFIEEFPAELGNIVWIDTNNNGVKDSGELGLNGIVIELLDASGDPVDADLITPGVQPATTTTAGGGFYAFTDLPPGTYQLRIASPPGLYPVSSSTTVTIDNQIDDDDNGSQIVAGGAITSPLIELIAGETDNTIDFGLTPLAGTYNIAGQVRDDYDLDGNFSDNDQPVSSVTVNLFLDSNDNGVFDPGTDTLFATTTTNCLGEYSFTNLPDGTYFVQEIDPHSSSSTADTDTTNDNLIKVVIAGADSNGNDFLDAIDPHGYIYSPVDGQIIAGGSMSVSGPGSITLLMDGSTGQYAFITDGTPGSYTLTYSPPLGYMIDPTRPVAGPSLDPTGLTPDPYPLGSGENGTNPGYLTDFTAVGNTYYLTFVLEAGDPFVINNNIPLVQIKPLDFPGWQYANTLGGQNSATDDPDGDGITNLEEFAFCYDPGSGINGGCPLNVVRNPDGTIDALVRRVTNAAGITYDLEYISNLANSGSNGVGWTNVTTIVPSVVTNLDGTEIATYLDLATVPALAGGQGFVRIKVTQTSSGTIARSEVAGWATRNIATTCQTCSNPFLSCEVFAGQVDAVAANTLDITTSAGTGDLAAQFLPGTEYYVEVTAGDTAGHRFEIDEASSTATSIVIDTASLRNTLGATVPATLAADNIIVRSHHTVGELFPSASFTSTNNQATADGLLLHNANTGLFEILWLYSNSGNPIWVPGPLTNMASRIIGPCEGLYVHPKGHPVTFVFTGHVRGNPMACPLVAGANLIGNGWPMDMTPTTRQILLSDGFFGARSSPTSDRLHFWQADENPAATGYTTHFLLHAASLQKWVRQDDASLVNEDTTALFKALRASFVQPKTARPNYVIATPWVP